MKKFVTLFLCLFASLYGANKYVATTGNNANAGTQGSPWATLTYAAANAGTDNVRVQAGTYNEQPTLTADGSSGAWINWVADGAVVCRGFTLSGATYTRIIGFEITHTTNTFTNGINFAPSTNTHIDLIDNYIHDINGKGITQTGTSSSSISYLTVRGNLVSYMGNVSGVVSDIGVASGIGTEPAEYGGNNDHILIEYNEVQKCWTFTSVFGTYVIQRNNYYHDFRNSYWTNGSDAYHSDCIQCGSDGLNGPARYHYYEAIFAGDCIESNSHFTIAQDVPTVHGDTDILLRGSIGFNFGSGFLGILVTPYYAAYNNTTYKTSQVGQYGNAMLWYTAGGTYSDPVYGTCANNLFQDAGLDGTGVTFEGTYTGTLNTNNWGYLAGTSTSYLGTTDPLMNSPSTGDFRLTGSSSSTLRTGGTGLATIISATGSGTSFVVDRADRLRDGYGMVQGDTVTIGATTTYITNITGSTVTVAASVSWTQNTTKVFWGTSATPSIGALPYGSAALTSATITNIGTSYTVTPTGSCRGVWFYVDGIPTTWDEASPYSATIASGTVTAKAYALYAQSTSVFTATQVGSAGTTSSGNIKITGNLKSN